VVHQNNDDNDNLNADVHHHHPNTGRTRETMLILTAEDILRKGLELGGFDRDRQKNVRRAQNLERFKSLYGSNPVVYAAIFEDLQMTQLPDARVDPQTLCVESFLMAFHFINVTPPKINSLAFSKSARRQLESGVGSMPKRFKHSKKRR
jgi:hypothetical protein